MKNKYDNKSMAISGEFQFKRIAGKIEFFNRKKECSMTENHTVIYIYMMITCMQSFCFQKIGTIPLKFM